MGEDLYRSRVTNSLRGKRREEGSGWPWGDVGRVGRCGQSGKVRRGMLSGMTAKEADCLAWKG